MKVNEIYVNLPVKDVNATRSFWTKLGFSINEQFSDDKAICVVLKEGSIYAMFLSEVYFKSFANRPVAKNDTTQVLLAISVSSRKEVDELVNAAIASGGTKYSEPKDHGWMYQNSFADLNAHQWEVMYADISQFEK